MTTGAAILAAYVQTGDHTAACALADWLTEQTMEPNNVLRIAMASYEPHTAIARFICIREYAAYGWWMVTIRNGHEVETTYCEQSASRIAAVICHLLQPVLNTRGLQQ